MLKVKMCLFSFSLIIKIFKHSENQFLTFICFEKIFMKKCFFLWWLGSCNVTPIETVHSLQSRFTSESKIIFWISLTKSPMYSNAVLLTTEVKIFSLQSKKTPKSNLPVVSKLRILKFWKYCRLWNLTRVEPINFWVWFELLNSKPFTFETAKLSTIIFELRLQD
jgi:hypothetical protein